MKLELLAQVLQDAGYGTVAQNIFVHSMDADCKQGILLRNPLDGVPVDVNLPGYYKHSVQIIVRSPDQATGDVLISNAAAALTMYGRVFNDNSGKLLMKINHLVPRTLPRRYPRLDGQGIEWTLDLNSNYVMP
jgi:hypothetical protein